MATFEGKVETVPTAPGRAPDFSYRVLVDGAPLLTLDRPGALWDGFALAILSNHLFRRGAAPAAADAEAELHRHAFRRRFLAGKNGLREWTLDDAEVAAWLERERAAPEAA